MNINPMNFIYNLRYMGIGMLGIFIVIGAIYVVTHFICKFFK